MTKLRLSPRRLAFLVGSVPVVALVAAAVAWACVPVGTPGTLAVHPLEVEPGQEVTLSGKAGGESPVVIRLNTVEGPPLVELETSPAPDGSGNRFSGTVVVPDNAPAGESVFVASQDGQRWQARFRVLGDVAPGQTPPPVASLLNDDPSALGLGIAGGALFVGGVAAGTFVRRRLRPAMPDDTPASANGSARPRIGGRRWAGVEPAAAVLLAGAGVFALLQPELGRVVAVLALVVLAAGLVGGKRHLLPIGLVLAGWGAGILLVSEDVLPARSAPVEITGIALGLLAALSLARSETERAAWLRTASLTAFNAGVAYYLAYDFTSFTQWPWWALTLILWAAWVQLSASRGRRSDPAAPSRAPDDGEVGLGTEPIGTGARTVGAN